MLRADPPFHPELSNERSCPSLIDLAAYADDHHLGEDEKNRIEAHVAGCEMCLDVLVGLRAEMQAIDTDARMLLVPSSVIHAAMGLRSSDALPRVSPTTGVRGVSPWIAFARRGVAIAACTGLAFAGYHIGTSFTSPGDGTDAVATANDGDNAYAFGLLDESAVAYDDSANLFALAFADALDTEATP